jgi:hypothetical protein
LAVRGWRFTVTNLPAFGWKHFEIPFSAQRRAWMRLAVWDLAGNGAAAQPVRLTAPDSTK